MLERTTLGAEEAKAWGLVQTVQESLIVENQEIVSIQQA
jgi:enoyl-CoA hydratase/carnithine racemase